MIITVLMDNAVYGNGLVSEHGLSLFICGKKTKILFDTGQSGNFINNAEKLGIDIAEADYAVISHGHYDHTGGLSTFIKKNSKASIYIKEEAFDNKCKKNGSYIGIPFNRNMLENRLILTNDIMEISDNIFIFPDIRISLTVDTHFKDMALKKDGILKQDEFFDEQFMVITEDNGLTIISGCSHRGITNIIKTASKHFNMPVNYVIGGFHLKNENNEVLSAVINELNSFKIKHLAVSHCTGIDGYAELKKECNADVFYNYTGNIIRTELN